MTDESPLDIVEKLDAAFNRKDIEAVLACYEDDAVVVVEPGKLTSGKENLRKFFEKIFEFDGVAQQEKVKVIESGNIALFISKWRLSSKMSKEETITKEFYATSVLRKNERGAWRLLIDNPFGPAILEN